MKQLISPSEARRLALYRQGLLNATPFGRGKKGAHQMCLQLGYVQIDTISVIQRTHHHVWWSRVPGYQTGMLHQLQNQDKKIFEYWSHAAAYLPIEDFRFSLHRKQRIAQGDQHWYEKDPKVMHYVLDRIREEGPLMARDFDAPKGFSGKEMWSQKPAKIALMHLFMQGELMISERKGFQKVFDLTERFLPPEVDTRAPSPEEMADHLIFKTVDAHGLARLEEMVYLRKKVKETVKKRISLLIEEGTLAEVEVSGNPHIYYARPQSLERIPARASRKRVNLLSPFDNAIIQRKRISSLFDFDFQIEIYVPAPKRQYGYFCLPILWGDRFIGRLDPKADRKKRQFLIRSLYLEDKKAVDACLEPLATRIKELALFNDCPEIVVEKTTPPGVGEELRRILT